MTEQLSQASGPAVDISELSHLRIWQKAVSSNRDRIALVSRHQDQHTSFPRSSQNEFHSEWTFIELDRYARQLATTLSRIRPVDRRPLSVLLHNQAEWFLFFLAAAYLHCPFNPINPKIASRKEDLNHMLQLVKPAFVVVADDIIAAQVEQHIDDSPSIETQFIVLERSSSREQRLDWRTLKDSYVDLTPPDTPTDSDPHEIAVILFTSGTTALPKPCAISTAATANAALAYIKPREIRSDHRYISHLPNFHSYGIGMAFSFMIAGAMVILPSPSFEPRATIECVEQFKATHMALVPTTAQAITSHPLLRTTNTSSLQSVDISGAGISSSIVESCERILEVPTTTSYGMTESPTTLVWPLHSGSPVRDGQVMSGMPSQGATVKVCEVDGHLAIPISTPGELHISGIHVIDLYMNVETASDNFYLDQDGRRWMKTGDQAIMYHDGSISICGRYKDIIIRGGENISPASIEAFLQSFHGILVAQVVGVPDDLAGEVPVAVIQCSDDADIQSSKLKDLAANTLGPAFAPKWVLDITRDLGLDDFPTTALGKIRKVELREIVHSHLSELQAQSNSIFSSTSERLIEIWKNISGADALTPQTTIQSFADSLMMMQLSGKVKQILEKDITVEDYKICQTIQDQIDLVDSRLRYNKLKSIDRNNGPPTLADVPHVIDHESFFDMKSHIKTALAQSRLDWDDVEDIVPMPDWDAIFAKRTRPQSWNLRYVLHSTADTVQVQAAFRTMLRYHPSLRSIVVQTDAELPVMVTMAANERWYSTAMTSGHMVKDRKALETLLLDDRVLDSAVMPGPMFRIHIAHVQSENTSGVVIIGSHAICDMTMTKLWMDDVAAALSNHEITPHLPFKDYALTYHKHRCGKEADEGVTYWTNKLKGIGSLSETVFWPEQRAPEFFKGNDAGWSKWNGQATQSGERSVSLKEKMMAQKGLRRIISTPEIAMLKSEHDVPVFMLVKAAIALLNVKMTSADQAIFATLNAARKWPFKADYSAAENEIYLGNPLDISGCTTEYVLDRISVERAKTIVKFMQDVTSEEEQNSRYAKTPVLRIIDRLRRPLTETDSRTWLERDRDADAVLSLIRRQSFNWLPTAPSASGNDGGLQMLSLSSRMDNGVTIGGFVADDKRSIVLTFTWDAEHLSELEACSALDDLASLVEAMANPVTWSKTVAEMLSRDI